MKKSDFEKRVVMAVEFECEDGHRIWKEVVGVANLDAFIEENLKHGFYLSDIDYCTRQDDDIRVFLDNAWEKFRESSEFGSLDATIDSMLEPDEPKKVWSEAEIKELIQTNDKVLYKALKKLYECQTEDEKAGRHTNEQNGMGFNKFDAEFLSSVSEFLIKTGFLTDKQKVVVRKKMVKYNKQLTRLANAC